MVEWWVNHPLLLMSSQCPLIVFKGSPTSFLSKGCLERQNFQWYSLLWMSYLVMLTKVIHPIPSNQAYLETWFCLKKDSWMASSTSPKKTLQVTSHVRFRVLVAMQVYTIMWFLLTSMRSSTLNIMYEIHKRMRGSIA